MNIIKINGKDAIKVPMTADLELATEDTAQIYKIIYLDGTRIQFVAAHPPTQDSHLHIHGLDEFVESEHPRGQPENAGQFVEKGEQSTKPKFNMEEWRAKGMMPAREEFRTWSREERDTAAQARVLIPARIKEILGSQPYPNTGSIRADVEARLDQFKDLIMPHEASEHVAIFANYAINTLSAVSKDQKTIRQLSLSILDHLVAQEYEAMARSLGDHGIHHIEQDLALATKLLSFQPPNVNTPLNRAALLLATAYHDSGYLTPTARVFLDADHPRWAAQHYRANISPMVRNLLGEDFDDFVTTLIVTHDHTVIDWDNEPEISALSTSDNMALFYAEKLPPFLREVPHAIQVLVELGSKRIDVNTAKNQMHQLVDHSSMSGKLKEAAHLAVNEVSPFLPKYTLGMLGTKLRKVLWIEDHPLFEIERFQSNEALAAVIDFGQKQFEKFAETYGQSAQKFIDTGYLRFQNEKGRIVLEGQLVQSGRVGAPEFSSDTKDAHVHIHGLDEFIESEHPRRAKGTRVGGQFTSKHSTGELLLPLNVIQQPFKVNNKRINAANYIKNNLERNDPIVPDLYVEKELKDAFPNAHDLRIVGHANRVYNCAAWAFGITDKWIWPNGWDRFPEEFMSQTSQYTSFDRLFRYVGGELVKNFSEKGENLSYEEGYVKIGLIGSHHRPEHVIRQQSDGTWISKCGGKEMIVTDSPHAYDNSPYGNLTRVYKIPAEGLLELKRICER